MANPMPNEQDLLQEIKKAGVSLDPRLWQILSHHIGNDIQVIQLAVKNLSDTPLWAKRIFKIVMILHRPFKKRLRSEDLSMVCDEALTRTENITVLLGRLRDMVKKETKPQPKPRLKYFDESEPYIRELH